MLLERSRRRPRRSTRTCSSDAARSIALYHLDRLWAEHLAELSEVREGVHLRALGRLDPLDEFHRAAVPAFNELVPEIEERTIATFEEAEIDRRLAARRRGAGPADARPGPTWCTTTRSAPSSTASSPPSAAASPAADPAAPAKRRRPRACGDRPRRGPDRCASRTAHTPPPATDRCGAAGQPPPPAGNGCPCGRGSRADAGVGRLCGAPIRRWRMPACAVKAVNHRRGPGRFAARHGSRVAAGRRGGGRSTRLALARARVAVCGDPGRPSRPMPGCGRRALDGRACRGRGGQMSSGRTPDRVCVHPIGCAHARGGR